MAQWVGWLSFSLPFWLSWQLSFSLPLGGLDPGQWRPVSERGSWVGGAPLAGSWAARTHAVASAEGRGTGLVCGHDHRRWEVKEGMEFDKDGI